MVPIVHIHFGPGKLGLGLLVWAGLQAGFDVHVLARPGSVVTPDTALELQIRPEHGDDIWVSLPIASQCQAKDVVDVPPEVRAAIDGAPDLLVTTAVTTEGLQAVAPLIMDLLEARSGREGVKTTFIAGENDPGPKYPQLVDEFERLGVDCRRTMVNRLCFEPAELKREGARVIRADGLTEWLIEGQPDTPVLAALAKLEHVRFVPDVEPFEVRKRWLVNGGHLALAILAREYKQPRLDHAATEPGRSAWLRQLHFVLIGVLQRRYPELEDNVDYAAKHVNAWIRHEDRAIRVLRRLKRADIGPFLRDLYRKLGEPLMAPELIRGESWRVVEELMHSLHNVLRSFEQYEDQVEIRENPGLLDEAVDENCTSLYHLWLTALIDEETADTRYRELHEAFADHRDRFS